MTIPHVCGTPGQPSCNHGYETFGNYRTADRRRTESVSERRAFDKVRRAEIKYSKQLRGVSKQIGVIVDGLYPDMPALTAALHRYSELLRPWAASVGAQMLADVSRKDEAVWKSLSVGMNYSLREEIASAPTGQMFKELLEEQVHYITSLPLDAARRAQELAQEAVSGGKRAKTVSEMIFASGEVSKSRANLIARTEVAKASSAFVQARAQYVGSEGYIWRTAEDSDVRKSHKRMSGKFVRWDSPPELDNMVGHAGGLPNCRCYPEPVLPDFIN